MGWVFAAEPGVDFDLWARGARQGRGAMGRRWERSGRDMGERGVQNVSEIDEFVSVLIRNGSKNRKK